jgi:hypothetical protein
LKRGNQHTRSPSKSARLRRRPARVELSLTQNGCPTGNLDSGGQPRSKLLPPPRVHADLGPPAALAAAHEQRPTPRVKVALAESERLLDAQPAAPEHDDQGARL